jgi:hypothetical protein
VTAWTAERLAASRTDNACPTGVRHQRGRPQDNSAEMMWRRFVTQHDQMFLELCGHQPGQAFRVDTNRFDHTGKQAR